MVCNIAVMRARSVDQPQNVAKSVPVEQSRLVNESRTHMTIKTQVLIVGAGPTGLMAACQLKRFGVPFILIDQRAGITTLSKALAVQARSLEIYEQMGLAQTAVEQGCQTSEVRFLMGSRQPIRIRLDASKPPFSPFPYVLMLEQSKNETLLHEYLVREGVAVRWQHTLRRITHETTRIIVRIQDQNGQENEIEADWVIAADGGHSPIRHQLGIPFEGGTYAQDFFVADTEMTWDKGYDKLFILRTIDAFCGFFPIRNHRYRLVGVVPPQYAVSEGLRFEDIADTVLKQLRTSIRFDTLHWFATYRVHHRCVASFRQGRVFLAGDAAHLHSPAGGQGMNTGLQDAYNLTWKLACVAKGVCSKTLLDTYNEERLPVARRLVQTTDRAFRFITSPNRLVSLFIVGVLPYVARLLTSISLIRNVAIRTVSQTRLNYRPSRLSQGAVGKLRAGDRFPYFGYVRDGASQSIYSDLRNPTFTLVSFGEYEPDVSLTDWLTIVLIPYTPQNVDGLARHGLPATFCCVVRPDNYIGFVQANFNKAAVRAYLKERVGVIHPDLLIDSQQPVSG